MIRPSQTSVYIQSAGIVCSLGAGLEAVRERLFNPNSGSPLSLSSDWLGGKSLFLGQIPDPLLPVELDDENTRNNQVLTTALMPLVGEVEQLKTRFGPERIGLVLGTSTSGIADGEQALVYKLAQGDYPQGYGYRLQEPYAPARYAARWLGIEGPSMVVSTACTSGGKALASAARLLRLGVCDAVIAGGVDTLCRMTLEGFDSLSVVSPDPCLPFSANRRGINLGEAAGLVILTREPAAVCLAGIGESSDAHHISAPHPEGLGAELAMQRALASAGLVSGDIDYLNFHGTGTAQNDRMEALATSRVLSKEINCGSTKGLTGHTLAAAGAIEAIFCWLALQRDDGRLPYHRWDDVCDPELPLLPGLARQQMDRPPRVAMSNSFAFGGNNLSLILART